MTDATQTEADPIRRIAHDAAADATPTRLRASTLVGDVPTGVDTVTTFDDFAAVTGDLADDIERTLRAEVDA
jgi:hypothetical protein